MNPVLRYTFISKLVHYGNDTWNSLLGYAPRVLRKAPPVDIVPRDRFINNLRTVLGPVTELKVDDVLRKKTIQEADLILTHHFDLLGSGPVKLDGINWHRDFVHNYEWPKGRYYKKYAFIESSGRFDVKVVWELNRCSHMLILGEAYLLTGDEKYAAEITAQIGNWIAENPYQQSINWTCSMDIAIRAVNWMYALNMIAGSVHFTESLASKVQRSLFEHCNHIIHNLEKTYPYSANHYASNIVGLLFLTTLFEKNNKAAAWKKFAQAEYFGEVRSQVLPSGVHYERSVSYHRLMTELFFYGYLLLKRNGVYLPQDITYRIRSMFGFIKAYTKPDGNAPMIGDDDDGLFLPFTRRPMNDHRYLLGLAAIAFPSLGWPAQKNIHYTIDAAFLLGKDAAAGSEATEQKADSLDVFDDAGFVVMHHGSNYLFVTNTEPSKYADPGKKIAGSHTHADLGSFVYAVKGRDLLIDPGTYCYTVDTKQRNALRSAFAHNTLVIDNTDIHELPANDVFSVKNFALPQYIRAAGSDQSVAIETAFISPLVSGVLHTRKFDYAKKDQTLKITDTIDSNDAHKYTLQFHFAPGLSLRAANDGVTVFDESDTKVASVAFSGNAPFESEIYGDVHSVSYGRIGKSAGLRVAFEGSGKIELNTTITT